MDVPWQPEDGQGKAEALLQKEKLFSTAIIESIPGVFFIHDRMGRFLRWNRRLETVSGYSRDEIAQMGPRDFFADGEKQLISDKIDEVFGEGDAAFEAGFLDRDGRSVPFSFTGRRITFDGENYLAGTGCESRARKSSGNGSEAAVLVYREAEERLVESERKYRELVELANSIILRWNSAGKITFLNEFGQRFFGYSSAEIVGRHVVGTIVPLNESGGRDLRQLMEQICADPAAFEQNVNENICRDGRRVAIAWTNRIVKDGEGELVEILSVGTDITERQRTEAALKESQVRFQTVAQNLTEGLVIADQTGVLYVNPAALKMMGFDDPGDGRNTVLNFKSLFQISTLDGTLLPEANRPLERVRRGESLDEVEVCLTRIGTDWKRIFSYTGAKVVKADGDALCFLSFRDITVRKQNEKEIERLGRLYAALSHVNQAIVHSTSRGELFEKVRRCVVEQAGFRMAWIGWHDPAAQKLVPVAQWGDEDGYLEAVRIQTDERPEGRGPTGTAFR